MKKINVILFLYLFVTMNLLGNTYQKVRLKKNHAVSNNGKSISLIPVEAYLENNNLVMCLVSREMEIITIVIKDSKGNIVFQDNIDSNIQDCYILLLENYPIGCYDLFVSDEDSEFCGHFDI